MFLHGNRGAAGGCNSIPITLVGRVLQIFGNILLIAFSAIEVGAFEGSEGAGGAVRICVRRQVIESSTSRHEDLRCC